MSPIDNWESIGIREGWIDNGWSEAQMMARIDELGLLPLAMSTGCLMMPVYLNFIQNPDTNVIVRDIVQTIHRKLGSDKSESSEGTTGTTVPDLNDDNGSAAWISDTNLWTPGQPITIGFAPNTVNKDYIKQTLINELQPHISMKLEFPDGATTGDIVVNTEAMSGGIAGYADVGSVKSRNRGGNNKVHLSDTLMAKGKVSSKPGVPTPYSGAGGGSAAAFDWPRYVITHEFGHAMGLWHEWSREKCNLNGVKCSAQQDKNSVMNYGGSGPTQSTVMFDTYSPEDINWLRSVYTPTTKPLPPDSNKNSTAPPNPLPTFPPRRPQQPRKRG